MDFIPLSEQLIAIRHRTAEALSQLAEPDLSEYDDEVIFRAFREVWKGFGAEESWLTRFGNEILELSHGQVRLEQLDPDNFRSRVKGPAEYLVLIRGEERKRVILGPYSSPVSFDPD